MEIWKDIPGFESKYQISNFGRIKTIERIFVCGNGAKRKQEEKILKYSTRPDGYYFISLGSRKNKKMYSIHRLVAEMFIPNTHNKKEVNHINGNKNDNRTENLEWCSKIDNYRHAQDYGLIPYKLQNEDIIKIKELYATGEYSQYKLAEIYNVNQCFISRIICNKRRNRAHLSKPKIN